MKQITLWYPEERPSYRLYDWDGNLLDEGAPLSADEVYCDLCNAPLSLNPAPMVGGYVLCLDCLEKVEPRWREQITPLLETMWRTQMASE
jgi:hypothetical protein